MTMASGTAVHVPENQPGLGTGDFGPRGEFVRYQPSRIGSVRHRRMDRRAVRAGRLPAACSGGKGEQGLGTSADFGWITT